jgi:ATP-binding cassette subfamily B protein
MQGRTGKDQKVFPRLKLSFSRLGQVIFVLREIVKIVSRIKPGLLVTVFVLSFVWGFSSIPTFYIEKLIIDSLVSSLGSPDKQKVFYRIFFLVSLSLLISLLRNILSSVNSFLRHTLSRYLDAELDVLMVNKVSQLSLPALENPEFMDRFNKIERESGRRAWQLMTPISEIPGYLAGFVSATAVLVLVYPLISLGVILVSLPRFFVNSKFIKREYDLDTELSPKNRVWAWVRYHLTKNRNFMELRILGVSHYLTEKMRSVIDEILSKRATLNKERESWAFFSSLPLTFYELLVSAMLIFWVVVGKITVGSFQLYLRSLRSAEQNLNGLIASLLNIYENYIYVADLVWFLGLPDEESHKGVIPPKGDISIVFKDVWFRYQDQQSWVLKDISFEVSQGEKIAIVGENGAGKSTLIKLLAGFYLPQRGEILIGNCEISNIDLSNWRKRLAVLFQDFELYPFSVREAIGYGDISRLDKLSEIKESAKKAGIDNFVESLPLGYDTPLTPEFGGGVRPSIGQWQRLGIARVLFRKGADILILDEPTSNVDPEAEERIFKELSKVSKDKFLIFVTQRFSTVRIADRIFVMDKGKIIETGTHRELMKLNGKYHRLFTLQSRSYVGFD